MAERAGDFEWRGEGESAEVVLYAPDDSAFERVLPASRLPGAHGPVYAAASRQGFGWVAASGSHAAPDLLSLPVRGLLLAADTSVQNLDMPPEEMPRIVSRGLSEVRLPRLGGADVRRICEAGARATAESGLIEEEDLAYFGSLPGEPDSLDRRALSAGARDSLSDEARAYTVGEISSSGALDLSTGLLCLVAWAGSGDLGRLALAAHRERILSRVEDADFGAGLPAAPAGTGEAADLLAAVWAASNFADGRAALLLYTLRQALGDVAGELGIRAAWAVGGIEDRDGLLVHRSGLAAAEDGSILVSGSSVVRATGKMVGSAPPFGAPEEDGRWLWEEAGLLERWAELDALGDEG
jgi:tRNA-splicing ligase RtcB